MVELILILLARLLVGAVIGLIPFFVCRYLGKPGLGQLSLICCAVSGLIYLSVLVAIGFVVGGILARQDYFIPRRSAERQTYAPSGMPMGRSVGLGVACLSGPLKGQVYRVGTNGMMVGRDYDCGIRFASETPGISRHHCSLRWQNGALMLTDLNSAYGTFLDDGRKLPPQYPVQVMTGSRFYLANTGYLFQITAI